jgi:hypothetical protein
MGVRNMSSCINPIEVLIKKQQIGREDADKVELPVLVHFDAARRGRCSGAGYNFISRHLVMAHYLSVRLRSRSFQTISECAGTLWRKAGLRPGEDLGLTTKEYRAIRACLGVYFRHLPYVEIGVYMEAQAIAEKIMNEAT